MKKFVLPFLVLAGFIFCYSTPEKPKRTLLYNYTPYDYAPEFLNGQVKSVKELSYWAIDNNGTIEKGALVTTKEKNELRYTLDYIAQFDNDGNITECKYFLDDNKFNIWDVECSDGKVVKATYTGNDTLRGYQSIDYDGLNKKISVFRLPEDTLVRNVNVFNNKAGIVNRSEIYNHENELLYYELYKTNEINRITEFKRYNAKDSLLTVFHMTYNDKGFNSGLKSFDGNGDVDWDGKFEYLSYDEYGNWTSMLTSNDGELKFVMEREYDYY